MALVSSREIFEKNTQIPNFMKIRPVEADLFDAGGRTDTTKLIVAFRNFANAPNTVAYLRQPVTFPEFKVFVQATLIC